MDKQYKFLFQGVLESCCRTLSESSSPSSTSRTSAFSLVRPVISSLPLVSPTRLPSVSQNTRLWLVDPRLCRAWLVSCLRSWRFRRQRCGQPCFLRIRYNRSLKWSGSFFLSITKVLDGISGITKNIFFSIWRPVRGETLIFVCSDGCVV